MSRKQVKVDESVEKHKRRVALNPDAREKQIIARAMDLAEKQIMEGTASSQVITHFLKLGSSRDALEREKLEKENELLRAKTEQLERERAAGDSYLAVIAALKSYNGYDDEEDLDDEEYY